MSEDIESELIQILLQQHPKKNKQPYCTVDALLREEFDKM